MNIEQIRNYCLSKKGTTESFPFDEDTLVFKVRNKMFAITSLKNWERGEAFINLKCDPDYSEELRAMYCSIRPGWHMSKKHWNSVYLHENELNNKLVLELIDHSYNLIVKSLPKKLKEGLI